MSKQLPANYYRSSRRPSQQPLKQRKKFPKKSFLGLILIGVLVLGGYHSRLFSLPFGLDKHTASDSKVAAAAKPVLTTSQEAAMTSEINAVIAAHPDMEIGVAIRDLNNDKSYHYGISEPYIAASISKILTATLFLHEVEQGQQTLSEDVDGYTAQYELQQLIEISDNTAWENLNDILTNDGLSAYASQIGLTNYDPDQNTLGVDDISLLLGKLYKGELLNIKDTNLLMTYMHDANYDNWIVASVPKGVKVYHKIGFLDDRVHDAAIIDNGKHPYVLVIFTKMADGSDYNSDEGQQVFATITTDTVQIFLQ